MCTINRDEARRFYDRFGGKQDRQGFYEDPAIDLLLELGQFSSAENVFELGCGTGKLAARLLADQLPASAHYIGVDLSSTMVGLATERLATFGPRQRVRLSDGGLQISDYGGPFDRVVTTYVLDLLSVADIQQCLTGAHAALVAGGLFCHAGLTTGAGPLSKATSTLWTLVHRLKPTLVGGCRPIVLSDLVELDKWRLIRREVVIGSGIASEVIVLQTL
jgi:ubiquinone/menaquinone biosynthesis C-methylase UbiE